MVWSGTTTRLLEHQQLRSTVDCLEPEPARVQHKARCHVINFASHKSVERCHSDVVNTHGASPWRTIALSFFFVTSVVAQPLCTNALLSDSGALKNLVVIRHLFHIDLLSLQALPRPESQRQCCCQTHAALEPRSSSHRGPPPTPQGDRALSGLPLLH